MTEGGDSKSEGTLIKLPHGGMLRLDAPVVMGIINVTPDSFSDGGLFATAAAAVAQGERLAREGAAILDIGGESTRPRAAPVDAELEKERIIPVLKELQSRVAIPLSVDTMKASVALEAVEAGAAIVNDVWGFQRDPDMARVVAETGAAAILMHNRGHEGIVPELDIIADVLDFLRRSIDIALAAGLAQDRLIVDPGFGFGKTDAQNFRLVRELGKLKQLGCPILLGVSRKSSLGRLTGQKIAAERLPASIAAALAGVQAGASIIRAHDVAAHVEAIKTWRAIAADP